MRILSLLYVYLTVLDSQAFASVPVPVSAKVSSTNFIHILEWSPGNGTRPGTVYNVKIEPIESNHLERNITRTSIDVSKYMKKIYYTYNIQLWASLGSDSSPPVSIYFKPYLETVIGPPVLSLRGCGNCLNISIDFPNREDATTSTLYNSFTFEISWSKERDEKNECHNPSTPKESKTIMSYSYVLEHLQPGERYCVEVQPKSSGNFKLLSSCSCEFTSREESRGVEFLAFLVLGSLLVGLCFLIPVFSLVYTGFLCKPKARLPRALVVLGPVYILSPEQPCLSVAELEDGVPTRKARRDRHGDAKEQINALYEKNEKEDDEEDEENEEIHNNYMDRGAQAELDSSRSERPGSFSGAARSGCRCEDAPGDPSEIFRNDGEGYDESAPSDTKSTSPPYAEENPGGPMKEEEDEEDSGNVNLWSVVLKSMQPGEDEADETEKLPLFFKEFQEDACESPAHSLLSHAEFQADEDTGNDVPKGRGDKHAETGYMASHAGNIDTGRWPSDDDDDDSSGYMTR